MQRSHSDVHREIQQQKQLEKMGTRNHNPSKIEEIPARIRPALEVLLEAVHYAQQTGGNLWEFSVELGQLALLGLTNNDFRWLVRMGLVEHQREVTLESDHGRAFRPTGNMTFSSATCFILSDVGISLANECYSTATSEERPSSPFPIDLDRGKPGRFPNVPHENGQHAESTTPTWDTELRVNGTTVKRFKWTAANQETVLAAFEEEDWPHRIDDPLPPHPEQDSKRRLSDTIKCLNRKQINPWVHFHGDGTGEGVTWELVEQNGSNDGLPG